MTRPQFWGCFALLLLLFLFVEGPVWRRPWDIDRLDGSIGWSYLPVPFLVAGCLLRGRRLGFRAFFLDALELTLLKYTVTFSLALVLWAAIEPPSPVAPAARPAAPATPPERAPEATPIAPETTGSVEGVVVDAAGEPLAQALVHVVRGLERYTFAPPSEAVRLENDGTGVRPAIAAVQAFQPIEARSTDGRLHTLVASRDGAALFNLPLLRSGAWNTVTVRERQELATVRCTVHAGVERESRLAVFTHPFFAVTAGDGRFHWHGVPAGRLRVAVWHAGGEGGQEAEVAAGGTLTLRLATTGR